MVVNFGYFLKWCFLTDIRRGKLSSDFGHGIGRAKRIKLV